MAISKISLITDAVLHRDPVSRTRTNYTVDPLTINVWSNFIRETLLEYIEDHSEPLGGPGVIVEVDEVREA